MLSWGSQLRSLTPLRSGPRLPNLPHSLAVQPTPVPPRLCLIATCQLPWCFLQGPECPALLECLSPYAVLVTLPEQI